MSLLSLQVSDLMQNKVSIFIFMFVCGFPVLMDNISADIHTSYPYWVKADFNLRSCHVG